MDKYGYGTHAVHLSLSLDTPFFRAPPRTDDVNEFGTSEYEHANPANYGGRYCRWFGCWFEVIVMSAGVSRIF